MRRPICWGSVVLLGWVASLSAAGLESVGNTDGLLTWQIGTLDRGQTAREVALFAFDSSHKGVIKRLEQARRQYAASPRGGRVWYPHIPPTAAALDVSVNSVPQVVWIKNEVTDFALAGPGHFFWEGLRQGLTCAQGGQLSRFGYYLHYNGGTARRAGTPITSRTPENLRIVAPIRPIDQTQAVGVVETSDKQLSVQIRAMMGDGPVVAVQFVLTNIGQQPLKDVRLSAYCNLESAHTHADDYSILERQTGGLLVVDPASNVCVVMAGLNRPASGYAGNWPSQGELQEAAGITPEKWPQFTAVPAELKKRMAAVAILAVPHAPAGPKQPVEPETRDLSPEEAQAVLERDWLFQADDNPTAERVRQEIQWTRQLAARLSNNPRMPDLSSELAKLDVLQQQLGGLEATAASTADPDALQDARELYLAVRRVKRRVTFKNPVVNFSQVLFIDNPYPQGAEWPHQARHRNGMMAVPGGRLLVLEGLHPGGHVRKLAPEKPGSFWRPDLSFDARRVLFCYKAHDQKSFHLYEINIDGTGLRQLTFGDYDDTDPIYLPDGNILFTTTRANTYVRCMPYTYSYVLARCDRQGKNICLLSRNNEPDWCPVLLNDGRACYSRWEYHDKALWRIQSLWTVNPDGTNTATFWGNQSVWPDHLAEPRPIPGSTRVMFTGVAHHDWFAGSIGIIDPGKGFNFPHGLTKVTCDVPWPECGPPPLDPPEANNYHVSGRYAAYKTPYPLSEEDFLVSSRHGTDSPRTSGKEQFRLYLMDVYGNRELIYEGHYNIWHAIPVVGRPKPPRHSDRVAWPGSGKDRQSAQPGVLYSADVYQGVADLPPGSVKYLRVIQMDARTYSSWTRDGRFSGPVVSAIQDDGVKRILGTAPVHPDGSVAFRVPAGVALHFQLLDEHYRALQTMRSFTGVMPGERRGCVGCHESHSVSPPTKTGFALQQPAPELTRPPWGTASISYQRLVQPVLDRYCGQCHQGEGEAREEYDLTLRPGRGVFNEPYLTLVGHAKFDRSVTDPHIEGVAGALKAENFDQSDPNSYKTFRPQQHLSYTSRLIELASSGEHYDVKVDPVSLRQLIGWVDANCPYRGQQEIRAIPDPEFAGIESLPIRPRTKTAPQILRP